MNIPDIKKMTLREKIAQLLIVRQCDLIMDAKTSYTKMRAPEEAAELAKKYQYGGIWLHGNIDVNQVNDCWEKNVKFDTKSLKKWCEDFRKDIKIPIIVANDAGGVANDLSAYPSGLAVGACDDEDMAFELGQCIAREMSLNGTDWLWSPMIDVMNRRASGVGRTFSNYADDIARFATAYMKGYQSMNVAATAKHFPGDDIYEVRDSHIVTTKINYTMEEWWEKQGRVFQALIDAGVDAVMSKATAFPAADSTEKDGRILPAGLSYKILTELLKEKMGFKGVVITDDVNMGGFTSVYSDGRLYAEFIKAGNDMLLGVGVDAVDLIEEEVKKGVLSEERIDDAVQRVFNLKAKVGLFDKGYREDVCTIEEAKEKTADMATRLAEKGITLLCDKLNQLPFDKNKVKKVAIICHTHVEYAFTSLNIMKKAFEDYGCEVLLRKRVENFEDAQAIAEEYDLIVYAGYLEFHAPKGLSSFYGDEFWSFRHDFVYGKEKSIGVSLGYPHIHYDVMDDANIFVNTYSLSAEMQKAFVKGVFGDIPFIGKSPVQLDE